MFGNPWVFSFFDDVYELCCEYALLAYIMMGMMSSDAGTV